MKIFSKLFKMFVFVIITPLIVTAIFLFYYQSHAKEELLQNYLNIAEISSSYLRATIEDMSLRLQFIDEIENLSPQNEEALSLSLEEKLAQMPDFVFFALQSSGGNILAQTVKSPFLNQDPSNANNSFLPSLEEPYAKVAYPTKNGNILIAGADIYPLIDKLEQHRIGASGGLYFVNENGMPYGRSNVFLPVEISKNLPNILNTPYGVITDLKDSDGVAYIGAYVKSPLAQNYIVLLQYKKEAFYTINLITWLIVFFVLATTTLSYFASLSFSEEVSEPIEQLIKAAQKISQNDFDVFVNPSNYWGEFELLINTFNAMSVKLKEYQAVQLDKLIDEKNKTDLLARLMRDGIIMCTLSGTKLFANKVAKRILESDAFAQNFEATMHETLHNPTLKDLLKVPSGSIFHYTNKNREVYFEVLTEIFRPANEEPVAIVIFRDITSEHEISEMKNDIFNAVAHDLRAPVLGLQGYIMLLQEGNLNEQERKQMLQAMYNSSRTLTSLVENILDISKLERGLLILNKTNYDILEATQKVISSILPLAQRKNITINNNIDKPYPIYADHPLMDRVITNLLSNAIKFTNDGGNISIALKIEGKNYLISIKDTGCGIAPEELPQIFEKYHQTDRNVKGYGLGLTIVKQIIEAHNGTIKAISKIGQGTEFIITIPPSLIDEEYK